MTKCTNKNKVGNSFRIFTTRNEFGQGNIFGGGIPACLAGLQAGPHPEGKLRGLAGGIYRPTSRGEVSGLAGGGSPGPHPGGGESLGVWPEGGLQAHTQWWGISRATPRGCISQNVLRQTPPSRWLLLWVVRILLECILVVNKFGLILLIWQVSD